MKNTFLILLTTVVYFQITECALAPDINLEGRIIEINDSKVLQLICSMNIAVQLCTVEFLLDTKTHDNIRYFDNDCYHTLRICPPTVCTCSNDCKSFTLNVTVTQDMKNTIYSCASRIESKEVIYTANISIIEDGNGGSTIFKKIVVPSNIVTPPHQATTFAPEISTVASFISEPLTIVIIASGFLFLVFVSVMSIICRHRCCNTKSEWERNSSPIDNLAASAGFQYMTHLKAPRKWKQSSPTLEYSKRKDTVKDVKYLRKKEKRPTISTISTNSGSVHSLDDIIFIAANISSRNNSYCSDA